MVIPQPLVALLAEAHEIQQQEKAVVGSAWSEWDLCFPSPLGAPRDPRDDWVEWKQLCARAGVREVRLHDARHTAATLLLEQGVDIRVVQEILGHSTLAVTKKYTHATDQLARDAADRMARALWPVHRDGGPLPPAFREVHVRVPVEPSAGAAADRARTPRVGRKRVSTGRITPTQHANQRPLCSPRSMSLTRFPGLLE
ncbi:tyrosine-type recombinase/integrase [Actinospica sp. MGRD01-02]|uniref:Tyrosine-type recombinase/integrase n=1 Tax=Actinospica acidithermotolerans TaxID=2828514 RepID=A0A941ILA1_9ACTN|nr:tyrosine-type recombinase/integrase [Actinospica acidithermotolerans]